MNQTIPSLSSSPPHAAPIILANRLPANFACVAVSWRTRMPQQLSRARQTHENENSSRNSSSGQECPNRLHEFAELSINKSKLRYIRSTSLWKYLLSGSAICVFLLWIGGQDYLNTSFVCPNEFLLCEGAVWRGQSKNNKRVEIIKKSRIVLHILAYSSAEGEQQPHLSLSHSIITKCWL